MRITLYAAAGKAVAVMPDPAIVTVGERVAWAMRYEGLASGDAIEWTIYFHRGNPFAPKVKTWILSIITHEQVLEAGPAEEPGDYKYGVRTVNAKTGQQLSDDDPYLIVRP